MFFFDLAFLEKLIKIQIIEIVYSVRLNFTVWQLIFGFWESIMANLGQFYELWESMLGLWESICSLWKFNFRHWKVNFGSGSSLEVDFRCLWVELWTLGVVTRPLGLILGLLNSILVPCQQFQDSKKIDFYNKKTVSFP